MAFVQSVSPLRTRTTFARCVRRLSNNAIHPVNRSGARMEAAVDVSTISTIALPASGTEAGSLSLADATASASKGIVILYFYPRDCTPGCTTEAKDFRDFKSDLDSLGAVVLGVSPDDKASHENFASKESLNFSLLCDDGTLADAFNAWKQHPVFGKVINRSTFILKDGAVVKEWRGVKATGHAAEVVAAVRELA